MEPGDWIIIDSNDSVGLEGLWLTPSGIKVVSGKIETKPKPSMIELNTNDVAMYIMWYEKMNVNSDKLQYQVNKTIHKPVVQSNYYLIHSKFDMIRVKGDLNRVPKPRNTSHSRRSDQKTFEDWHNNEFSIIWEMDQRDDRDFALSEVGRRV